jgi:hypothetical protein
LSAAFAEHNAAPTTDYIQKMHDLAIINAAQFTEQLRLMNDAADS